MKDRCPACGALVLPDERICPRCGASLDGPVPVEMEQEPQQESKPAAPVLDPGKIEKVLPEDLSAMVSFLRQKTNQTEDVPDTNWNDEAQDVPRTIEELLAFCQAKGMPLERMRFFIGSDYREPKAFGIYRDGDNFVVYKNKADGRRAERYHGPDEAYAVRELYFKLLDECHNRGFWPEGKADNRTNPVFQKKRFPVKRMAIAMFLFCLLGFSGTFLYDRINHANDGYYTFDDASIFYRYGNEWYQYDDSYDWIPYSNMPKGDYKTYFAGREYNPSLKSSSFMESAVWAQIMEEERASSSYDDRDSDRDDWNSRSSRSSDWDDYGWDSDSTDWDSDW